MENENAVIQPISPSAAGTLGIGNIGSHAGLESLPLDFTNGNRTLHRTR